MTHDVNGSDVAVQPNSDAISGDSISPQDPRASIARVRGALVSAYALADKIGASRMRLQALDGLAALRALS